MLLSTLILALLAFFILQPNTFTIALPAPNLPLSQQNQLSQDQNSPSKGLCILPIFIPWFYPCTWTSSSTSALQKLSPVVMAKYMVKIPVTLVESMLVPFSRLAKSKENELVRSDSQQSRDDIRLQPGPNIVTRNPHKSRNAKRLDCSSSSSQTATTSSALASRRYCWYLGFLYPCSWNLPACPKTVKVCTFDVPSKRPPFQTKTCVWVSTSAGRISRSVPAIFALPAMLIKSVSGKSLSRPARYRGARSVPVDLEILNSTTKPGIQGSTSMKQICWWVIWAYKCVPTPKPAMPYQHCEPDVPSKDDKYQTFDCNNWIIPSSAHASFSVPRIFILPSLLLEAVHAIPFPSRTASSLKTPTRAELANPLQLENLNGTDFNTANVTIAKGVKQCWIGTFLWPYITLPPPSIQDNYSYNGCTGQQSCEVVSDTRNTASAPRGFGLLTMAFKGVISGFFTEIDRVAKSELRLGNSEVVGNGRDMIVRRILNHCWQCINIPLAAAETALKQRKHTNTTTSALASSKSDHNIIESRQGTSACLHSEHVISSSGSPLSLSRSISPSPSSSSSTLTPPHVIKLLSIMLALMKNAQVHAIPFPKPELITNSIADPNFDILKRAIGEIMEEIREWLMGEGED
ncbi:hypothetical protein VTL71DRAFT_12010 [Oculimacula yallundae]|uniref:Uncharacterized protein n=1 Tax=Oculimacula yallundae TaxID=86028 RepID=A0ABR4CSB7_9HELO